MTDKKLQKTVEQMREQAKLLEEEACRLFEAVTELRLQTSALVVELANLNWILSSSKSSKVVPGEPVERTEKPVERVEKEEGRDD